MRQQQLRCSIALGLLGLTAACGGIETGGYAVYRVGVTEEVFASDCGVDDEGDSSTIRAGTTFIVYLPAAEEETPFLDLGGVTLPGVETDEGYTFEGTSVDTEQIGGETIFDSDHDGLDDAGDDPMVDSDEDGIEDFADDDVDVDMDGDHDLFEDDIVDVDGDGEDDRIVTTGADTLIVTEHVSVTLVLDGANASGTVDRVTSVECEGECNGFESDSCSSSSTFVGVELDDAEVDVPA